MLILLLTLSVVFSVAVVSAIDTNSSDNHIIQNDSSVNYENQEINHPPKNHHPPKHDFRPDEKSVSKDFDFFGLFTIFKDDKKHGYWVLSEDMKKVDLDKLSKDGVNIIFLNSYAFTEHGQRDVLDWINRQMTME